MHLSIVTPVYNAEKIVPILVERLNTSTKGITNDFEIKLIEDHSSDNSWDAIEKIAAIHHHVVGLKLSRNFGQHHAITAGLDHAKGDWVVVMDCDLQDQPEEIGKLYHKAIEGYDIVLTKRINRRDSLLKKLFSKIYPGILSYLSGTEPTGNFVIYNKKSVAAIVSMRESIRCFSIMVKWAGFKHTTIEVKHGNRYSGKSSYNFSKLINFAADIVLAYSDKPLRILVKTGGLISFISVILALIYLYKWFSTDILVGFTSLILSIWILSGFIIASLGMIGLYVDKTFEGVKNRLIYIISEKVNSD
jgi:dolichol-phosphate mannosyltransferase